MHRAMINGFIGMASATIAGFVAIMVALIMQG